MCNSGNPVNYLRICFNAFYYLGIFPFRFRLNESTNRFEIVQHRMQKILCLTNFIFGIAQHVLMIRGVIESATSETTNDPLMYFKMASIVSGSVFWATIFISLYCKSTEFLNAVNHLHSIGNSFQSKRGKKAMYLSPIVLCTILVYLAITFLNFMHRSGWDWWRTLDSFKSQGIRLVFMEEYSHLCEKNVSLTLFFAVTSFVFSFSFILLTTFGEILLLNCAFCMGDLVDDFAEAIKRPGESNLKVLDQYESLRQVSNSVNKAVGVSIFGEVLTSLPYFVSNFVEFIHPVNMFVFTLHLIEFGNIFGFVVLAANVHRKASAIEEWILDHQNLSHLSLQEINILLHNISSKSIAFSGSGFFQITSGFLGSFVSLLLTFSVILIQFRDQTVILNEELL